MELLHIVYHSLERGVHGAGQTLHDVVHRARYEIYPGDLTFHLNTYIVSKLHNIKLLDITKLYSFLLFTDVLLMCNAVQNLLHRSPAASLAPRPSNKQGIAKSMITNASFRTKKLPGMSFST